MAEQANIFVKNLFTNPISIHRKLANGNYDLDLSINHGDEGEIFLPDTTVALVIKAPTGVDTKNSPITVKSSIIDLGVLCSQVEENWLIRIIENKLPPEVPTTVNITVGADGP
jgi:hypothetical protein